MQETDNFKNVFQYDAVENNRVITIDEDRGKAKIRHLNINSDGISMFLIREVFSCQLTPLFKKMSCCTKNADGVIFFERPEGKSMVLCELKSSGGGVFSTAYQQTFATYMKTCMAMSICEDFNINNYKVYFVFTAQDGPELAIRRNELEQIDPQQMDFYCDIRLRLLKGEKVKFRMSQVPHNCDFLHHTLVDKEVECFLLTSPTDSINFNINSLT